MDGQQTRNVQATVDTGAAYTTLPGSLLREIGVAPVGKRRFLLAERLRPGGESGGSAIAAHDQRRIELDCGEARASINGESVATLVVFGEDDAPALLGAYTLEGLALAVDPVEQRLIPTHLIMY